MISNISRFAIAVSLLYLTSCAPTPEDKNPIVYRTSDTTLTVSKSLPSNVKIDTLSYITKVKNYTDSLNKNISGLLLSKVDVFGESAEGGEISIYRNHSDTLKLIAIYYGESGKKEYDFILRYNQLVAYRETASYYTSQIGKMPVKIDRTISTSFILYDGEVVAGEKGGVSIESENYLRKSSYVNDIYLETKILLKQNSH